MKFDREYYRRFYLDPATAVTSRSEMDARGRLIAAFCDYAGMPVRTILDAGCGVGLLRKPLLKQLKRATYTGVEVSEYLCKKHGWTQSTVEDFRAPRPFDLVICYDVLQYHDERSARRAIANLARHCRGVLYFGVLTRRDWQENCDQRRTDPNVHLRTGAWYAKELGRYFRMVGAGFWIRRGAPLTLWETDVAGDVRSRRTPRMSQ